MSAPVVHLLVTVAVRVSGSFTVEEAAVYVRSELAHAENPWLTLDVLTIGEDPFHASIPATITDTEGSS